MKRTLIIPGIVLIISGFTKETMAQIDTTWAIHDMRRPRPPVVMPAPFEQPTAPPSDAIVLFDGTDLSAWEQVDGGPAGWRVENGYMEVVPGSGNIQTRQAFGDVQLHLEWSVPEEVTGEGQGRGNSGVFLMVQHQVAMLAE